RLSLDEIRDIFNGVQQTFREPAIRGVPIQVHVPSKDHGTSREILRLLGISEKDGFLSKATPVDRSSRLHQHDILGKLVNDVRNPHNAVGIVSRAVARNARQLRVKGPGAEGYYPPEDECVREEKYPLWRSLFLYRAKKGSAERPDHDDL